VTLTRVTNERIVNWSSVYVTVGRPSVRLIDQQQQRRPADLLLIALRTAFIDRQPRVQCCMRRSSAANAGSVTLRADG